MELFLELPVFLNKHYIIVSDQLFNFNYLDSINNQQRLFRIVNRLLHRKAQRVLPVHSSSAETAKGFSEYFSGKIDNICRELYACRDADECLDNNNSRGFTSELTSFVAPPMEVIKQIITDASPKSCDQDPSFLPSFPL